MEGESQQQQRIVHVVVPAESVPPQEDRVDHAQPVNDYGKQEAMSVSEPSHERRLIPHRAGASGIWGDDRLMASTGARRGCASAPGCSPSYGAGTIFTPKLLRRNVCIWLIPLWVLSM